MNLDGKNLKRTLLVMMFAALLVLIVMNYKEAWNVVRAGYSIINPFVVGACIAYLLNIPMAAFEKILFSRAKGKMALKLKRPISMLLTFLFVLLLVGLLVWTVVPQLSETISELGQKIPVFYRENLGKLEKLLAENPEYLVEIEKLKDIKVDWKTIAEKVWDFLRSGAGNTMFQSTILFAGNVVGGVINAVISLIFAIYLLSSKEKLLAQVKGIMKAYLKDSVRMKIEKVSVILNYYFHKFIAGQCTEAIILGLLFFIVMVIFSFPYALLISVLIAFSALIPIVGAFIGCTVGCFLILVDDPMKALWFLIVFLIIQQIEGNMIYPKVVGSSVGLPSMWVLFAVTIGASLGGVVGMLIFIPICSTAYTLLREGVCIRNGVTPPVFPPVPKEAVSNGKTRRENTVLTTATSHRTESSPVKRKRQNAEEWSTNRPNPESQEMRSTEERKLQNTNITERKVQHTNRQNQGKGRKPQNTSRQNSVSGRKPQNSGQQNQ